MEQHVERNASSAHHLRDVWLSIGGTVVRIEVMAMVAIFLTFYAVTFGSCRRWSSRWIIQLKGFPGCECAVCVPRNIQHRADAVIAGEEQDVPCVVGVIACPLC